ncbi:hypothetical protein [Streptosporangium vulgare]|uniref:Uncharacterized protein n=1 Tax=Streptosporangium vulgare TaxID=46190 RepID=A0ABV5TQ81_9ACTN
MNVFLAVLATPLRLLLPNTGSRTRRRKPAPVAPAQAAPAPVSDDTAPLALTRNPYPQEKQ